MANKKHFEILKCGVNQWNEWRESTNDTPDLSNVNLRKENLNNANFSNCNLTGSNCSKSNFSNANFSNANITNTDFKRSYLRGANMENTNFFKADFSMADLRRTKLCGADLNRTCFRSSQIVRADFTNAILNRTDLLKANLYQSNMFNAILTETLFSDTDLTGVNNLSTCKIEKHCTIDIRTLERSINLPADFLENCGFTDDFIKKISKKPPRNYYSCFISYSRKDYDFASKLHSDLSNSGVLTWIDHEDMQIGDDIFDTLTKEVSSHQRVIFILSENALRSEWVGREAKSALGIEERERKNITMPLVIDDSVYSEDALTLGWLNVMKSKNMGDFKSWQIQQQYDKSLKRLLKDLSYCC